MKPSLLILLVLVSGALIWQTGDDKQFSTSAVVAAAPTRLARVDEPEPPPVVKPSNNPEVMNQLRDAYNAESPEVWRAAIANALPVLATDQDAQFLVGDLLISRGDIVDGLAWQLLACMYCTFDDLGHECVVEGLCDPNLAYIDVLKRDFGEQRVADALVRMEEIRARITTSDPSALAIFTEIDDARFPRDVGECVQLRTPTPECPPEEILRQTREAYKE